MLLYETATVGYLYMSLCNSSHTCIYHFRFPKDERYHKWLEACKIDEDKYVDTMRVCSKHFLLDDFNEISLPKRVLLDSAIPCPTVTTKGQEPLTIKTQKGTMDYAGPSTSKGLFIVSSFPQAIATGEETLYTYYF